MGKGLITQMVDRRNKLLTLLSGQTIVLEDLRHSHNGANGCNKRFAQQDIVNRELIKEDNKQ
jgi:hypothetical protein